MAIFILVSGYGTLVYINWLDSSKKTTELITTDINEDIGEEVITFIQVPYHVNEVNPKAIENSMLDLPDEKQRERFFVISAFVEPIIMTGVSSRMLWAAIIATLCLLLLSLAYYIIMRKYLMPLKSLLQVSAEFSAGDLSKRVDIVRNDEFGLISKNFNSVADKMQSLIDNVETMVQVRTEELHKANQALKENKDELQLILDSAAEAIFCIDLNGNCTFCNYSSLKMLGYQSQEELLGKNMHRQIHHTHRDGTPFLIEECKIIRSIREGNLAADDEIFWRKDDTSFSVECHSHPQRKEGKVVGGVVTFIDITERNARDAEIKYLGCHDVLTGLRNRRCFEEDRITIDIPENLPLSVIFADINGLKLTNDIFGHAAGDELIKKSSEILKQACRQSDVITRIFGDEFIILLPKTTEKETEKILDRIRSGFLDARVAAIKCSISLGLDTKTSPDQPLEEIMANAENTMYKDKILNRKVINKDIIDTLIETLHSRTPREKQHSIMVSELCSETGAALQLSETKISKLYRAGYLHDLGKIVLDESILNKDSLSDEEREKMRQHSVSGYRILNLFDDTLDIAEYVYSHHERWDGSGYPRGLKGERIPLISRIIAVADTYDRVLIRGDLPLNERKLAALEVIKKGAGTQFDPQIAEVFAQMINKQLNNACLK